MPNMLPYPIFPGFTHFGVVSPQVQEIAVQFNAEGLEALSGISHKTVAWADVGTRVNVGTFEVKVPVRLTSLLGFEPFEGERKFHKPNVAAVTVKANPWQLNLEWPFVIEQGGIAQLQQFYGVAGLGADVVDHARAFKADLAASLLIAGQTNASLSMTAKAFTLPQPGLPSGLPLFSDGTTSGSSTHFSNPLNVGSSKFANLFLNQGKITDSDVFGTMLTNMSRVPHPSKANMTLGLEVTDVIGGTGMLIPFWKVAIQQLALQTTTSPANLAAATTNIYNPDTIAKAGAEKLIGASGIAPWRFWIAPQLDSHPYIVANPTKQMWYAVSRSRPSMAWGELVGPSKEMAPRITLLGDGTESAKMTRMIRMLGDLDGGAAAGLPHCIAAYYETTP